MGSAEEDRTELLELLRKTSVHSAEGESYRLSSGAKSSWYVDCKMAMSLPRGRALIGKLIFDRVKGDDFDVVGGLAIGAYPIATAVSDAIYEQTGKSVRAFVVRKEAKRHGLRKMIEGQIRENDRALIVDDVVTAGGSVIEAITQARKEGLRVSRVVVLVDREEQEGRQKIEAQGVPFEALYTLAELLKQESDGHTKGQDARSDPSGTKRQQSARTASAR
ncbi:MAG: orotate phosphoribosyltransferase [Candidatus Binataceae bacterium]